MRIQLSEYELPTTTVLCTRTIGAQTNAEFIAWLESYQQTLSDAATRRRKLVSILDLTLAAPLTAQQRRIQSDWNESNKSLVRAAMVSIAFVAPSIVLRGVLTAVFWIKPPPVPHHVSSTVHEALSWSLDTCEDKREPVPNYVRERIRKLFQVRSSSDDAHARMP